MWKTEPVLLIRCSRKKLIFLHHSKALEVFYAFLSYNMSSFEYSIPVVKADPKHWSMGIIGTEQCCGSGMFLSRIPDPDPTIFSSRIRIQTFFHPGSRILHQKWNANSLFSCFLCLHEESLSLIHSQNDPGSGKNSPRIPWVKSTGSGSASATPEQKLEKLKFVPVYGWMHLHYLGRTS
jgi:hypothetical protein